MIFCDIFSRWEISIQHIFGYYYDFLSSILRINLFLRNQTRIQYNIAVPRRMWYNGSTLQGRYYDETKHCAARRFLGDHDLVRIL